MSDRILQASPARHNAPFRVVFLLIVVIGLLMLARRLPLDRWIDALADWVGQLGPWGPLVLGLVYVAAALLLVPGSALTLAAGAVFGLTLGTITVSLASTAAAALAFLIARYVARARVRSWAARHPRFAAIDAAIGEGDWRVVGLLRLSPAVPFSLSNYLYGLTPVRFVSYVLVSWVAMLPGTFLYVYYGYIGRSALAAASGDAGAARSGKWALLVVGLAATLIVTLYVGRLARRALARQAGRDARAPMEKP